MLLERQSVASQLKQGDIRHLDAHVPQSHRVIESIYQSQCGTRGDVFSDAGEVEREREAAKLGAVRFDG